MTKGYDPVEYWTEAGSRYLSRFVYTREHMTQQQALIEYLKGIEFKTVLELGCGFGRIAQLILSNFEKRIDNYTGIDISEKQLKQAELYTMEFDNVTFKQMDIQNLPIFKETFDLVISVEVLMHQLPSKIQSIINDTVGLSNRHVINVDYYTENKEELESHNFKHDYLNLYPYMVKGIKISGVKQWIFHMQKRFEKEIWHEDYEQKCDVRHPSGICYK